MTDDPVLDALRRNFAFLLEETFASPERPGGTAYLDQRAGWYPTLESLTANDVSRPLVPGGTTIAGHVEHARFHLEVVLRYMRGSDERADWAHSWRVHEVTEESWQALRAAFVETAERALRALGEVETWGDREVGGAFATVAHAAYHLGAVRQMLLATRR